jgi:peptide/nickel transport system ATP-binding protein
VTALVGESGSGKSVSAMAVLGLLPRTARVGGSIVLRPDVGVGPASDGVQLVGATPATLRAVRGAVVSLVSQEPMGAWNPVLTVGDQVAEAVRAHRRVRRREAHEQVRELLRETGLTDPDRIAAAYPHQLSGGQLQRALIAMALAQDSVAIVADEPTTALDVTVQAGILDVLRRLRDERGTATLLITHDMGVVADLADDVVVMRGGHVLEHAEARTLFAAPRHAYTRALLDAVPQLGATTARPPRPVATPQAPSPAPPPSPSTPSPATSSPATPPPPSTPPPPVLEGNRRAEVESTQEPRPHAPVVRLTDVRVTYPGTRGRAPVHAVDGVSLTIERGQVLGLVGESGSGKTTLGQVVAGLLGATAGRVVIAGTDLAQAARAEQRDLRRRTGVVFQDPASTLDPRWTVARSVAEPLRLHTGLTPDAVRVRVEELLDAVHLRPELARRYPHELSGGQRQRVAIARAVALDPDVLVADEPTSALDVSVQARVLEVFRELQERLGFACLFISHDLAVVERVCDRVAVMHRGAIVEDGLTADVLARPRDPYTRALLGAAPVADPQLQAERRAARAALVADEGAR